MDAATINGALHASQNRQIVNGSVQVSGNGQTIQFVPANGWAPGAFVEVFLDASATDVDGNSLNTGLSSIKTYEGTFTTGVDVSTNAPTPISTSPAPGASNIPLNAVIAVEYNVPLDSTSVNG